MSEEALTQGQAAARTKEPTGARRTEIIDAAATLFDKRGYHSTSMEDIAEHVGLAKPTLYHYFRGKDEILLEIHTAMIEDILASHESRLPGSRGRWGQLLKGMMGDLIRLMETHPGHLRIFFEHQRELPDKYQSSIRQKRNTYREHVRDVIDGGIADGDFRGVDPELATLAVLGISNWTYQWLRPGGKYTADQVTEVFYALVIDGLGLS
jgi:TetR/AcrR family transcriptional regulator, cholesterol catabolism regulator